MLNFFDYDNKKYRTILKGIGYTLIVLSPIFLFVFIKWDILRVEHSSLDEESENSFILLCFIVWIFFFLLFHYKKEIKNLNKLIEAGVLSNKLTKEDVKKIPLNELEELKTLIEDYKERTSNKKWISSKIWWTMDNNTKIIDGYIFNEQLKKM